MILGIIVVIKKSDWLLNLGAYGGLFGVFAALFFTIIPLIASIIYFPQLCLEPLREVLFYVLFAVFLVLNTFLMRSNFFVEHKKIFFIGEEVLSEVLLFISMFGDIQDSEQGLVMKALLFMTLLFFCVAFSLLTLGLNWLISYGFSKIKFSK